MSPEPDEVVSNGENGATGRWLRAMADMEHENPTPEEPDDETGPDRD